MEIIKSNWQKIILVAVLIAGIVVGVYLVQIRQVFKPKAFADVNEAFEVTDDQGNSLKDKCKGDTCQIDSLKVNIRIKDVPALLKR